MLHDRFGRAITYLRISVTDRCNFRCVYCMPVEGIPQKTHESILRYEEIEKVVRVAAANGVREVRLTGGEPLVRLDLPDLVAMLKAIPGIEDISLTTNGVLLEKMAAKLAKAGLNRVNVSLDTLDEGKYRQITRGGSLESVWRGIAAVEAAGLQPIKLNSVAMRGVNEDELVDQALLTMNHPWHIRFIELMPVKNQASWGNGFPSSEEAYISIQEIMEILSPLKLQPVPKDVGLGPAHEYRIPGGQGVVGLISPVGEHFCQECNRLRLTSDGNLRPCLLSDGEVPILESLRSGEDLLPLIEQAIALKPEGHGLSQNVRPTGRCMMQIGG